MDASCTLPENPPESSPSSESRYSLEKAFDRALLKVSAVSHPPEHQVEFEFVFDCISPISLEKKLPGASTGITNVSRTCFLEFMLDGANYVLYDVPSKISFKAGSKTSLADAFNSSMAFIQFYLGDPLVQAGLQSADFNPKDIASTISCEELLSHSSKTLPLAHKPALSPPEEKIILEINDQQIEKQIEIPLNGPMEGDKSKFSETVKYLLTSVPLFDASKIYFSPITREMNSYILRAKIMYSRGKLQEASRDINRAVTICDFLVDNRVGEKGYDEIHPLELLSEDGFIAGLLADNSEAVERLFPDYKEEFFLMKRISFELLRAKFRTDLAGKEEKIKDIPSYLALSQDFLNDFIERYYNPGKITFFADNRHNMSNMGITGMDEDSSENIMTFTLDPSFADALFNNERAGQKISVYVSLRNFVRSFIEKLNKGSEASMPIAQINPNLPCLTLDEKIRVVQKMIDAAQEKKEYARAQSYKEALGDLQFKLVDMQRTDPLGFSTPIM